MSGEPGPQSILFISHEFPPYGGGAGRLLFLVCEALYEQGVALQVMTQRGEGGERSTCPFPVLYLSSRRTARFVTNIPAMVTFIVKAIFAKNLLRNNKPTVVVSNMAVPGALAGYFISKRLRVPHGIWHHGSDVHFRKEAGASWFFRGVLRFLWRSSSLNVFVSASMEQMARSYGMRQASAIVPVAIGTGFSPSARPPSRRLFLFAGRMELVKNPMLFAEAAALCIEQKWCEAAEFHLVGSGALFSAVHAFIDKEILQVRIHLFESRDFAQMVALYQSAYAVVIPSVIEGFPLTVIEAARCGVPSIGARTPGVTDALDHEKTGLLFKAGSVEACALAMKRLYDEPGLRDRLASAAYEKSVYYSVNTSARAFLEAMVASGMFIRL